MEELINKDLFIRIYKENIKRQGSEELLNWLINSDFFVAPASSKFHSAKEGGLCEHSIKSFNRFVKVLESEYGKEWSKYISTESAAIIALLHDVCKVNFYKVEYRNVKDDGVWVQKPYYTVDDSLPYGHGEKSVYIISGFMKLSREEAMAINWHMGGFDDRVKGGSYSLKDAFNSFPVALLFHIADMQTSYLDEQN